MKAGEHSNVDLAQAGPMAAIGQDLNLVRAQHDGRWVVEELIDVGSGPLQVNESSDTGLDAQTPSGKQDETGG